LHAVAERVPASSGIRNVPMCVFLAPLRPLIPEAVLHILYVAVSGHLACANMDVQLFQIPCRVQADGMAAA